MANLLIRDIVYLIIYLISIPVFYYVIKALMKSIVHEIVLATHKEMQQSTSAIFQQIADNYEVKDIARTKDLLKEIKNLINKEEEKIFKN